MNKRGQISLNIGIVSILVVLLVFIAIFVFSSTFRFLVLGTGMIVMSFIVLLGKGVKNDKTRVGVFIALIAVGFVLIFASGVLQSTFSVDQVNVGSDGKVYWLVTAVADSIDERYEFTYTPEKYTKNDGTEVIPQVPLGITFTKKEAYCKYTQIDETYKDVTFKVLSNPDRVADIYIQDGKGNIITMDGTVVQSKQLDSGLTVKTQGIISGKNDCPNYENVAVLNGKLYNKDDYKNAIDSCNCAWYDAICYARCYLSDPELNENTQFISAFDSAPTITSNEVKGKLDIGNGIFTITANEDYFESVTIIPSKEVDPRIDSIVIPSEIKAGDTSSLKVTISNREDDSEGIISIKATSDDLSITSSSKNVNLRDDVTVSFLATAGNDDGASEVCIEVSSTGQFGSVNTDTDCKSFLITEDQPDEYCGDGTCQASESYTTCSDDCTQPEDNDTVEDESACAWYQESYVKTEKDYGNFYWRAYTPFVDPIETEVTGCKTSILVNIILILMVFGSLGGYAIYVTTRPKRRRK